MTQGELGSLSGLGRATIASIERGRQAVAIHQAVRICRALGTHLSDLLGDAEGELQGLRNVLADHDLEIVRQLREQLP